MNIRNIFIFFVLVLIVSNQAMCMEQNLEKMLIESRVTQQEESIKKTRLIKLISVDLQEIFIPKDIACQSKTLADMITDNTFEINFHNISNDGLKNVVDTLTALHGPFLSELSCTLKLLPIIKKIVTKGVVQQEFKDVLHFFDIQLDWIAIQSALRYEVQTGLPFLFDAIKQTSISHIIAKITAYARNDVLLEDLKHKIEEKFTTSSLFFTGASDFFCAKKNCCRPYLSSPLWDERARRIAEPYFMQDTELSHDLLKIAIVIGNKNDYFGPENIVILNAQTNDVINQWQCDNCSIIDWLPNDKFILMRYCDQQTADSTFKLLKISTGEMYSVGKPFSSRECLDRTQWECSVSGRYLIIVSEKDAYSFTFIIFDTKTFVSRIIKILKNVIGVEFLLKFNSNEDCFAILPAYYGVRKTIKVSIPPLIGFYLNTQITIEEIMLLKKIAHARSQEMAYEYTAYDKEFLNNFAQGQENVILSTCEVRSVLLMLNSVSTPPLNNINNKRKNSSSAPSEQPIAKIHRSCNVI